MNLKSLIGKLNETTRGALEAAAGLCLARTHYDIEIEHYLLKLMDAGCDFVSATRYAGGGQRYGGSRLGHVLSVTANNGATLATSSAPRPMSDCPSCFQLKLIGRSFWIMSKPSRNGRTLVLKRRLLVVQVTISPPKVTQTGVELSAAGGTEACIFPRNFPA